MKITFDLEGVEELSADFHAGIDTLGQDLQHAVLEAADAAISEMQGNHPYQDRTFLLSGGMYVKPGRMTRLTANAEVRFQAPYANIVEDGQEGRARPYPITPQGIQAADIRLQQCVDDAAAAWCATMAKG